MAQDNTAWVYAILRDCVDETLYHRPIVDDGGVIKLPISRERKADPALQYGDLVDKDISVTRNVEKWRLMLKVRAWHHNRDEHTAQEMTRLILLIRANTRSK